MGDAVYFIAQVQVEDWDAYQREYVPTTRERIHAHGGEILVGTSEAELLEGSWDCNWTVVIKFPSKADCYGFFEDEEYAEVIGVRHDVAEFSNIVVVPEKPDL